MQPFPFGWWQRRAAALPRHFSEKTTAMINRILVSFYSIIPSRKHNYSTILLDVSRIIFETNNHCETKGINFLTDNECRQIILFTWNYSCYRCRSIGPCSMLVRRNAPSPYAFSNHFAQPRFAQRPNSISPIIRLYLKLPFSRNCRITYVCSVTLDAEICSKEKKKEKGEGKKRRGKIYRRMLSGKLLAFSSIEV